MALYFSRHRSLTPHVAASPRKTNPALAKIASRCPRRDVYILHLVKGMNQKHVSINVMSAEIQRREAWEYYLKVSSRRCLFVYAYQMPIRACRGPFPFRLEPPRSALCFFCPASLLARLRAIAADLALYIKT